MTMLNFLSTGIGGETEDLFNEDYLDWDSSAVDASGDMFAIDLELGSWSEDLSIGCNVAIFSFRDLIVTLSVDLCSKISKLAMWAVERVSRFFQTYK